jgi:hypothetical protein
LSATDILFFLMGPEKGISRYITNTNYCNVFLQVPLHKRLRAQLGYRLLDDSAGSYPLVFHQADAGLSLRIHTSVWLNLGWKYYAYNEEKSAQQDYAGNLLSLSLRFGF